MDTLSLEMAMLMLQRLDGVALTDKDGRYVYVSDNWVKVTGLQPENVIHKYAWEIVPETKLGVAIKTKKPILGAVVEIRGIKVFTSYWPIMKGDELLGAFVCIIMNGMENALDFTKKVNQLSHQLEYYKEELKKFRSAKYDINNIIGESHVIQDLKQQIMAAARSNSTVLIEGETGSGKELIAHAIHNLSSRNNAPFIRVNCSAIPSELMESEFFGYEEGSFTGAKKGGKQGKFELAYEGSLFLDEVNQLPLSMQPKFLRVLQEHELERIGGKSSIPVDVRIIAATNVSLEKMIEEKKFRSDLFYRLNVIKIQSPLLRERKEDIPLLVKYLIDKLNAQLGMAITCMNDDVIDLFMNYDWPGNIRELQNVLESAMNRAWGKTLEIKHFEQFINKTNKQKLFCGRLHQRDVFLRDMKAEIERQALVETLKKTNGNKVKAAKQLDISRTVLYKKLSKYNLI